MNETTETNQTKIDKDIDTTVLDIPSYGYGKQFEIDAIYGSNKVAKLREFDRIIMPEGKDKEKFIELMKKKGI